MKRIFIAAALLSFACPAFGDTIRPSQALANQGAYAIVEGIAHVHDGGNNSAAEVDVTDKNNGHLTAVIPERDKSSFPQLASYDGKTVDVTGTIQLDDGRAEITVNRANQLKPVAP